MTKKYLDIIREIYPTKVKVRDELISLNAKLYLPKNTEYFFSDLHGESEGFIHLLRSASGNIRDKTEQVYGTTLGEEEQDDLASLVYDPENFIHNKEEKEGEISRDRYKVTIYRLVNLFRFVSTKYPKDKVKSKFPQNYSELIDELLYTNDSEFNKKEYYDKIIENIIRYHSANDFIIALAILIQKISVDRLHIVGDIYDRGPNPDEIMDELVSFENVDIQWGNHDMERIAAGGGHQASIAAAICSSISYNNFDFLEEGYGFNLRPLYEYAITTYKDDPCELFMPKVYDENIYDQIDPTLAAKMYKAMSIIRFKLDGQLIERNPDFHMDDRNVLKFIDFEKMTYKGAKLKDTNFPTIDPKDPLKLTKEEEAIIVGMQNDFLHNRTFQRHIKFFLSHGAMYKISNGCLIFHGCIPFRKDGEFDDVIINGNPYHGKGLMDELDRIVREGYWGKSKKRKQKCLDISRYLFNGAKSPLFGKSQYSYFENIFVDDKSLKREILNPYYTLTKSADSCDKILREFGLDPQYSRIVNGHIPVKVKDGALPVVAGNKLYRIDGGISKPYQEKTGIAGYTLIFNSHHIALAVHENYTEFQKDLGSYTPKIVEVEKMIPRFLIKDTDEGRKIREKIGVLEELLDAYNKGVYREKKNLQ